MTSATDTFNLLPATRSFLARGQKLLIGGKWVDARSGRSFEVHDPATGQVISRCAEGAAETSTLPFAPLAPHSKGHGRSSPPQSAAKCCGRLPI